MPVSRQFKKKKIKKSIEERNENICNLMLKYLKITGPSLKLKKTY